MARVAALRIGLKHDGGDGNFAVNPRLDWIGDGLLNVWMGLQRVFDGPREDIDPVQS
jgi:hypothetical protein